MSDTRRSSTPLARAWVALLTLGLSLPGCAVHKWRAVPLLEAHVSAQVGRRLARFQTPEGSLSMRVTALRYPYVEGVPTRAKGNVVVRVPRTQVRGARRLDDGPRLATQVSEQDWRERPPLGELLDLTLHSAGRVRLKVDEIDATYLSGRWRAGNGVVEFDLRRASALEVQEVDSGKTILAVVGGTLAMMSAALLVVMLTKESCPIVYVDRGRGDELVGEAYAGAAFRSLQRDDLLPLPELPAGRVQVRLRDEAHETQYTDRAELLLVEHDPELRVLSDHTQQVRALSPSWPARRVVDDQGQAVSDRLADADGHLWETDMAVRAAQTRPELGERLEAEFDPPPPGSAAVLELVAGNTPWIDLVFGRFFAAHGRYLPRLLAHGNAPESGARIRAWRAREGLDLGVESFVDGRWREVARVPTVGPMALRRVAVPLPAEALPREPGVPLRLRLSAGLGFWRFDQLALARELPTERLHVQALAPSVAQAADGSDARAQLAQHDGRYDVLTDVGDTLELAFDLPPVSAGQVRSAFLSTNGYYNVREPAQPRLQLGTLRTLQREPRSLSRFSLDLARAYLRHEAGTARMPVGAVQP